MTDVGDEIVRSACASVDKQESETKQKLVEAGVQFLPISAEFRGKLDSMLRDVGKKWAEGLDSRGKKGSEALAEFQKVLAEQGGK